jgi:hypothetical protein
MEGVLSIRENDPPLRWDLPDSAGSGENLARCCGKEICYSRSFQIYKNSVSLAVATLRLTFRVARLSAERTFSLLSASSPNGTFKADPSFSRSRSLRIVETICLCFPVRPCGTSACATDSKCIGFLAARETITYPPSSQTLNKDGVIVSPLNEVCKREIKTLKSRERSIPAMWGTLL